MVSLAFPNKENAWKITITKFWHLFINRLKRIPDVAVISIEMLNKQILHTKFKKNLGNF